MIAEAPAKSNVSLWDVSTWKIRPKLTLFFSLLAIVPVIITGIFVVVIGRNSLLGEADARLIAVSQTTAERIDEALTEGVQFVNVMAQLPEIARFMKSPNDSANKAYALAALKAAASKAPEYETVAVVNRFGVIELSSADADVGTDVSSRLYVSEALKGASYISDPSISLITDRPAIFFSAPVRDENGAIVGVVRSRLSLHALEDFIEDDLGAAGTGSFGMLLDENGIRLGDSRSKINPTLLTMLRYRAVAPVPAEIEKKLVSEKRFGKNAATQVEVQPLPEIAAATQSKGTTTLETAVDLSDARHRAAMATLTNKPWRYVVAAPLSTYTAVADNTGYLAIGISGIALIVAIIVALALSRAITVPLTRLSSVADRISLGELDAKIEVTSHDEIGELAEALARMQASLQAAIERLRARRAG
ncbi:MAG: HAMP domain-containing protein [Chloroflexi bacterium]|nr:HAMP domain-containing protein [Chloroflexota bacterium]